MAGPGDPSRRRLVSALGLLVVVTTVVSALAAFANPPVDESLYREVRALDLPSAVGELSLVSAPQSVGLLALLGLFAWRCRGLMAGYVSALAAAIALTVVLGVVVSSPRPYDSYLTTHDSYPSLAVTVLTVIAVMLPACLRVLTGTWVVPALGGTLLWVLVAAVALEEVYDATRWPIDVAGGALLGGAVAVAALTAVEQPSRLHTRCDGCPWQQGQTQVEQPAPIHGGMSHPLYRTALVWALTLAAAFGYLAHARGIPRVPGSGIDAGTEGPLNLGLVGLVVVGVLVAARWHVAGTVVVAGAAVLLGYASSVQYPPWVALLVTAAAAAPALMLWVQWHRVANLRSALGVTAATSVLLGLVVYLAAGSYSAYWGPTHPASSTPAPATGVVEWMWSGAVTSTGMSVRARTADDVGRVRLVVSEDADLETLAAFSPAQRSDSSTRNVVTLSVVGLTPGTEYYYALELDGKTYTDRVGRLSTFPAAPGSFTFAVGSDARTGSNGRVFDAIRRLRPLFYLNDGDWFYGDMEIDEPDLFRSQYEANLASPAQAALYASTPIAYVWDDHDYAADDADRTSASRPAAMEVYRQLVPHYPLHGGPESPINQAFTVGGVRFVLTDGRSARDPVGESPRSMLGAEQRAWLLEELADADRYDLVVWANGVPWVGEADPGSDTWAGFAEERRMIADAIARDHVDNLLMVSGDAHMLAYDDGTHTDYSTSGDGGFPLFQAAALDRNASVKGGPYTGPVLPGGGQFGTVTVRDTGQGVRVIVRGWNWKGETLFTRSFLASGD